MYMLHLFSPLISSGLAAFGLILLIRFRNIIKSHRLNKIRASNLFFIWVIFSNIFYSIYFFTVKILYESIVVSSLYTDKNEGNGGGFFTTEGAANLFFDYLRITEIIICVAFISLAVIGIVYWTKHKQYVQQKKVKLRVVYTLSLLVLSLLSIFVTLLFFILIVDGIFSVSYGG